MKQFVTLSTVVFISFLYISLLTSCGDSSLNPDDTTKVDTIILGNNIHSFTGILSSVVATDSALAIDTSWRIVYKGLPTGFVPVSYEFYLCDTNGISKDTVWVDLSSIMVLNNNVPCFPLPKWKINEVTLNFPLGLPVQYTLYKIVLWKDD